MHHFFLTIWGGRHILHPIKLSLKKIKGSCLGLTLQTRVQAGALLGQALGLTY